MQNELEYNIWYKSSKIKSRYIFMELRQIYFDFDSPYKLYIEFFSGERYHSFQTITAKIWIQVLVYNQSLTKMPITYAETPSHSPFVKSVQLNWSGENSSVKVFIDLEFSC